jgi:transposase, IS5 family
VVSLAEALNDRTSFRRLALPATKHPRAAFVRFRRQLVEHGLDQSLFAAITRDLEKRGATIRKGTSPQSLDLRLPRSSMRR